MVHVARREIFPFVGFENPSSTEIITMAAVSSLQDCLRSVFRLARKLPAGIPGENRTLMDGDCTDAVDDGVLVDVAERERR